MGGVCCSGLTLLPTSAISSCSSHWGNGGVKGERSWHEKGSCFTPSSNSWRVSCFWLASFCWFCSSVLVIASLVNFFKSFLIKWLALINEANYALISPIESPRSPVCSFLFCFRQLVHEKSPIVSVRVNNGISPASFASFMPDAIVFPLINHLKPKSAKLLLLGHPPNWCFLSKFANTNWFVVFHVVHPSL